MEDSIIHFIRQKDYILKDELGHGACGKTVLLYDETINEHFVCKKYAPHEQYREKLFKNFVSEIKILHLLSHRNIVRVFNYHIYPEHYSGFIVMEYVKGPDLTNYLKLFPENIDEIFLQAIKGFVYLEECKILHRDIRPMNILVTDEGILKIIDFGFSKKIIATQDFDKSISLNWWCQPPLDFSEDKYNFSTEVYFVGKLFEKIIFDNKIEHFSYKHLLKEMCQIDPSKRIQSFSSIEKEMFQDEPKGIDFNEQELFSYREFSSELFVAISKIERRTKYKTIIENIELALGELHRNVMLEEYLPSTIPLIDCFLDGAYYYNRKTSVNVHTLKIFLELLRSSSKEKKNIILRNIHSKLSAKERYEDIPVDDIPF